MKYTILLAALWLAACSKKQPDQTCYAPGQIENPSGRLVVFGDSQTAGFKSCHGGYAYSWADFMADQNSFSLVNTAVPGTDFVSDQESGAISAFQFQSDDVVAMLIGYNDMANFGMDASHLQLFKDTLTATLQALSPKVRVVLIGTCLHPWSYKVNASPAAVDLYRQATKQVVSALGITNVVVFDVDQGFAGNAAYYNSDDMVHIDYDAQVMVGAIFDAAMQIGEGQ